MENANLINGIYFCLGCGGTVISRLCSCGKPHSDYQSKLKSIFLSNLQYFYGKLDGSYDFPNSVEGDLLKQAKKEIEELQLRNE